MKITGRRLVFCAVALALVCVLLPQTVFAAGNDDLAIYGGGGGGGSGDAVTSTGGGGGGYVSYGSDYYSFGGAGNGTKSGHGGGVGGGSAYGTAGGGNYKYPEWGGDGFSPGLGPNGMTGGPGNKGADPIPGNPDILPNPPYMVNAALGSSARGGDATVKVESTVDFELNNLEVLAGNGGSASVGPMGGGDAGSGGSANFEAAS